LELIYLFLIVGKRVKRIENSMPCEKENGLNSL